MQTDRQIQMKLETYRAKSLQEALRLVRSELGPDAEVVHSREIPGRFFGWFGAGCIEVTAASGEEVARGEISEVIGVRTERPNGKANRALPETI